MSEWLLRPPKAEDFGALSRHCWHDWPPDKVQNMLDRAQKIAELERGWALVAVLGEEAIGFGLLSYWRGLAELSDLIVAPNYRGQGIGAALIGALCDHAKASGYAQAQIGVAENNPRALALYLRLGFEHDRRLILRLREDYEPVYYLLKSLGDAPE